MDWPALITAVAALIAAAGAAWAARISARTHKATSEIKTAVNGASEAAAAELKRVHTQLEDLREELSEVQSDRLKEAREAAGLS